MSKRWVLILSLIPMLTLPHVQAQDDEEEAVEELIVVTASMRVTAGGAQDIAYARSEILSGRIPHPHTFTDEGLLSQYDLTLPGSDKCQQLFCVFGEAIDSDLLNKPNDRYFVGLGFASNIDGRKWKREAQNIVAVVDKSGSMSGPPLDLVRKSLTALTDELTKKDKLSIVLYGDRSHVYLEPTTMTRKNRRRVREQIAAIESAGSTNMEEGLQVGYALARDSAAEFSGNTRVVLFTDERPNVGDTSAEGFIGMAKAASNLGIGLTTIGVGVQFDSSLAIKLSSTRGGNLYFLPNEDAANRIFGDEFDYMVSEVAHDLTFVLRPHADYEISGVYGVPGDLLAWTDDRAVTFTIPTVFLSSRGGGVFATLAPRREDLDLPASRIPAQSNVLAAAITYTAAKGNGSAESSQANVSLNSGDTSNAMQTASLLIDEYLGLRTATTEHYVHNNQEGAYQTLRTLHARFYSIDNPDIAEAIEEETTLIAQLLDKFAFLSGHTSEVSSATSNKLWGIWRIAEARTENAYDEFEVGSFLLFSPDNRILRFYESDYSDLDWDDWESYIVAKSGLVFLYSETEYQYEFNDDQLTLSYQNGSDEVDIHVVMEYAGAAPLDGFVPEIIDLDDY